MYLFCVLLPLLSLANVSISFGFVPRNWISLQTIISSEAIISTLVERLKLELLSDNFSLLRDVLNNVITKHDNDNISGYVGGHSMNLDYLYLCVLVYTLSSNPGTLLHSDNAMNKWHSISMFSTIKRRTNVCILVLMILFNRNIENAI